MHSSYAAIDIVAGGKRAQNEPIETKFFKQTHYETRCHPQKEKTMNSIYSELVTSPFTLSLILLHLVVFAQCAIKLADYTLTKQQLEKIN